MPVYLYTDYYFFHLNLHTQPIIFILKMYISSFFPKKINFQTFLLPLHVALIFPDELSRPSLSDVRPLGDCAYSEHLYFHLPVGAGETRRLSPGSCIPLHLEPFTPGLNCHFIKGEQMKSFLLFFFSFFACVCVCEHEVLLVMTAWITNRKSNICSSSTVRSNTVCVISVER